MKAATTSAIPAAAARSAGDAAGAGDGVDGGGRAVGAAAVRDAAGVDARSSESTCRRKTGGCCPAGINTLGCLVHKDGAAAIVIEHELLQIALTPEEIDATFVELELATIKEREADRHRFRRRARSRSGRRRAVVDFQRRGAVAARSRCGCSSLVQGKHLYRLVCVAPASRVRALRCRFSRWCAVRSRRSDAGLNRASVTRCTRCSTRAW